MGDKINHDFNTVDCKTGFPSKHAAEILHPAIVPYSPLSTKSSYIKPRGV